MLLSLAVVAVLGTLLLQRIADGLVDAKVEQALAEAGSGAQAVQDAFDGADRSDRAAYDTLAGDLVAQLSTRGGPGGANEVILLRGPDVNVPDAPRVQSSSFDVRPDTVPQQLRERVQETSGLAWTFVKLPRSSAGAADGPGAERTRSGPAVAIGAPVVVPAVGQYELYFLFPLDREQATLALVRRTLGVGSLGLVLLVGLVAWIVTRQVVTPVRMAARISERLAAGRLEERMSVRGEDDLARLATAFNKMATNLQRQIEQLEDLSRIQRRFVSDVSHELRTPITTVRMAADVLHEARPALAPPAARAAELLQDQLDRFESLLSDLLEISRYDAHAAELDAEPADLRSVVEHVVAGARPLADNRGTELRLHLPDVPVVAEVDRRRIERILRNLVVNAIEHGEGRPVDVTVRGDDDAVAVAVRDHGVGLAPADVTRVFDRFWRADPARTRTSGGTGLGLSIALEDAHLHGGWLQAWGEPGNGSAFRLTVPARQGVEVRRSPIPLVPADAGRRPVSVGGPYRRLRSGAP